MNPSDFDVFEGDVFAFYGILMNGVHVEVGKYLEYGKIPGKIWSVHDAFPALSVREGEPDTVRCRLWRVPEDEWPRDEAVRQIDATEGFSPYSDPEHCMYLRRRIKLVEPDMYVWAYEWNGSFRDLRLVPDGDWERERRVLRAARDEFWGEASNGADEWGDQ